MQSAPLSVDGRVVSNGTVSVLRMLFSALWVCSDDTDNNVTWRL